MATYDAGIVTAYGAAVRGGYTGTYEEFCAQQANYAQNAAAVEQAKQDAQAAAQAAETAAASLEIDATLSNAGQAADAKKTGDELYTLKEDLNDIYASTGIYAHGYEQGGIKEDGTDLNTYPNVRIRSKTYIALVDTLYLEYVHDTETVILTVNCYDENKTGIGVAIKNLYISDDSAKKIITYNDIITAVPNAKYIRLWISISPEREIKASEGDYFIRILWDTLDNRLAKNIGRIKTLEDVHTKSDLIATHNTVFPDFYNLVPVFGGFVAGTTINDQGGVSQVASNAATKDYLEIDTSRILRGQLLNIGGLTVQNVAFYDADEKFLDYARNISLTELDYPLNTKYIKFSITVNQLNTYSIAICYVPSASTVITEDNLTTRIKLQNVEIPYLDEKISAIPYSKINNIDGFINSEKAWIGIAGASNIRTAVNSDGTLSTTFSNRLIIVSKNNDTRKALEWNEIITNIPSTNVEVSGNVAVFKIPTYRALVINIEDNNLYLRTAATILHNDYILVSNTSYQPDGWAINKENYQVRITGDDVIISRGVGEYNTYENGFGSTIGAFSASLNNVSDCEPFLFVTDPHIFGVGDIMSDVSYQKLISNVFGAIETCYKSSPAAFVLYGGDWLNNSDSLVTATQKLGMIRGAIKNSQPGYLLVGNHDTNYQGEEKLSVQTIKNLWYDGNNTYYKFKGRNTTFYCFDTGTESQSLEAQDYLGQLQAEWFASSLLSENSQHIAIAVHILFPSISSPTTLQPLTNKILEIAEAYNSRSTIEYNSHTYDYASVTGRAEFLIAGHTHVDGNYYHHGIPCVVTRNAYIPSNSKIAFDFIMADYSRKLIKTFRVGYGENRTIDMTNGQLVTT